MRPIVLVNGPPGSGKDTLGEHLIKKYPSFDIAKFAWELKERTHALYGRPELPHDHFEQVKEKPSAFFLGLTPRQAYIQVSETYFKPVHGDETFGKLLVQRLAEKHAFARGFVITDSGFESETVPMLRHFGADSVILVRIRGRGDFSNDSRSFLSLPVYTVDIFNTGAKHTFLRQAEHALDHILQPMLAGDFV